MTYTVTIDRTKGDERTRVTRSDGLTMTYTRVIPDEGEALAGACRAWRAAHRPTPAEIEADDAVDLAVDTGRLSLDPDADNYAGLYTYAGRGEFGALFARRGESLRIAAGVVR